MWRAHLLHVQVWRGIGGAEEVLITSMSGFGPAALATGEGFQPAMSRACPLTVKVLKIKYVVCVLTCIYRNSTETRRKEDTKALQTSGFSPSLLFTTS